MSAITCAEVRASAAEFALGVGDGVERADVVAHLGTCSACREHVETLTETADALLIGGPVAEPSTGFEERVARAMVVRPVSTLPHRAVRWALAAAAVALVVFGTGLALGRISTRSPKTVVRSAAMRTPDGRTVGRVEVGADPDTVFVALPGWRPQYSAGQQKPYRLRITLAGGRSQLVGPVQLAPGDGSWGTVLPVNAHQVRSVALVSERGHTYCRGTLTSA